MVETSTYDSARRRRVSRYHKHAIFFGGKSRVRFRVDHLQDIELWVWRDLLSNSLQDAVTELRVDIVHLEIYHRDGLFFFWWYRKLHPRIRCSFLAGIERKGHMVAVSVASSKEKKSPGNEVDPFTLLTSQVPQSFTCQPTLAWICYNSIVP